MWIPDPGVILDSNMRIAIEASARALLIAAGLQVLLREVYVDLLEKSSNELAPQVKVCTHHFDGEGYLLNPVQVYHLNVAGLLGEQENTTRHGFGSTGYSRSFSWRMLDVARLYELVSDESLTPPKMEVGQST